MWIVVGTEHAKEARPVVERRTEDPFMEDIAEAVVHTQDERKWPEDGCGSTWNFKDNEIHCSIDGKLEPHPETLSVP